MLSGDDLVTLQRIVSGLAVAVDAELHMVAVVPWLSHAQHGLHPGLLYATDTLKHVANDTALELKLGGVTDMLPLAATAAPIHGAGGRHARVRRAIDADEPAASVGCSGLLKGHSNRLPGQRHGDEYHLSLISADGIAAVGHVCERQLHPVFHLLSG